MVETIVLKGTTVANKIKDELKEELVELSKIGISPKLAILRIGEDPSDLAYERGITKNADKIGLDYCIDVLDENVSHEEYVENLNRLNNDESVSGILLFRPFPKHFKPKEIYNTIAEEKDVDCLNSRNLGKIFEGDLSGLTPCTPWAVIELLKYYDIQMAGQNVCVINRSLVVGKPLSMMLLEYNATVTICHTSTEPEKIKKYSRNADIVVCATGNAKMFDSSYFTEESIVIDVGMSMDEDGNMSGDVDFDEVNGKVPFITPVFGGIGPVTTTGLLRNTIRAEKRKHNLG